METWANQGAITSAKMTHEQIRRALGEVGSPLYEKYGNDFEIYLQGSYANDTNIRGDSDVDIVVQLNSSFFSDISTLTPQEQQLYNEWRQNATHTDLEFRADVIQSLQSYFGVPSIQVGNKSIKVLSGSGRLAADVVACIKYRRYLAFRGAYDQDFVEGISFHAQNGEFVVHFPKLHYKNGTNKNAEAQGWFKQTVRLFKNIRSYMVDRGQINGDLAPSYFLECMVYNVPSDQFESSLGNIFCNLVNWLAKQNMDGFVCQNEQCMLFGPHPDQWSKDKATQFLNAAASLWNNWR